MLISSDSEYLARPKVLSATLDDGVVLLELDKGTYFGLNEVGQFVWEALQSKVRLQDLEEKMSGEFNASRVEIRADLLTFIGALLNHDLIYEVEKRVESSSL